MKVFQNTKCLNAIISITHLTVQILNINTQKKFSCLLLCISFQNIPLFKKIIKFLNSWYNS